MPDSKPESTDDEKFRATLKRMLETPPTPHGSGNDRESPKPPPKDKGVAPTG